MSADRVNREDRSELVELEITNVAHGGVMVARLEGRVVFVADAIPGERVLARIVDDAKASFWRADTVEVLEASPDRRAHVWDAASLSRAPSERAGGAEFGHIALERQRALKGEVLTDALRRMGGLDRVVEVEPIGADRGDVNVDVDVDGRASGGGRGAGGSWGGAGGSGGGATDGASGAGSDRGAGLGSSGGGAGFGSSEGDAGLGSSDDGRGPADRAPGTRWRTRVRLHVGPDGRVGPYAARSHTVVPVDDLPLATEAIEEAAALACRLDDAVAVDLVETSSGEVRVTRVREEFSKTGKRSSSGAGKRRGDASRAGARAGRGGGPGGGGPGVGGAGRGGSTGGRGVASGAEDARAVSGGDSAGRIEKPATIVERVGEREFRLAENGFWQVHRDAARTLSEVVSAQTRADLFDPRAANHDLYGGVGLLAAAIGDRFGAATRITSVESDSAATDYASENLAEWIGARAVTARVDRYLADLERQASAEDRRRLAAATMVIDPPRSGAGKQVVGSLTRLEVAQVVYVACDPVAFARDVALFREAGYELDSLRAFDLFPHTHHVESVGVLVKS
jgi:tRNA/tmRNA/rRNA uracil-C5-methylase (TrmA/RlmC/RlmD family)